MEFKVGDVVKVISQIPTEDGRSVSWVDDMDKSKGQLYTVQMIDTNSILLSNKYWYDMNWVIRSKSLLEL